jgi:hypothetical protein
VKRYTASEWVGALACVFGFALWVLYLHGMGGRLQP